MDRSMLRQAGTRRTSQRARRSAFTVTWTSTPDPVDTAGLGMADTVPHAQSISGLRAKSSLELLGEAGVPQSYYE